MDLLLGIAGIVVLACVFLRVCWWVARNGGEHSSGWGHGGGGSI